MCSFLCRSKGLPRVLEVDLSPSSAGEIDREYATKYFPTAAVLVVEGTAFFESQSLHCCFYFSI